jgi:hypothetical protein
MGNDWSGYIFVFAMAAIVMVRLDRLGRQIEAVSADIRADVARTEEEREEILGEWKQAQKDAAKDARQFWIFLGHRRRCGADLGGGQTRLTGTLTSMGATGLKLLPCGGKYQT